MTARTRVAIDLKLFCASAECADRKLDVLETKFDAPNESSAEKTIRH